MAKHFSLFVLALSCIQLLFSQELTGVHEVTPSGNLNGFTIKTTVSGLQEVDVARMVYLIDGIHTFVPSVTNNLFANRSEDGVSFYLMEIPSSGVLVLDFGVELANPGAVDFQVEFHYFKNQNKKYKAFPSVYLLSGPELALQTNAAKSAELEAQETAAAAAKATAAAELTFAVALNKAAEPTVAKVAELDDQEVSEKAKEVPKRKYTIQLLALSKFSQDRLDYYCKKHKLDAKMLINMRSEEWVKIFYGKFDSEREAISVRDNLVQNHHLSKLMVVVL